MLGLEAIRADAGLSRRIELRGHLRAIGRYLALDEESGLAGRP